jgi:hypothetical protein
MRCTPLATSPRGPSQTHQDNKTSHVQNAIPADSQDQFVLPADSSADLQSVHLMYRDMGTIMPATRVAQRTLMRQVQVQQWIEGATEVFESAARRI